MLSELQVACALVPVRSCRLISLPQSDIGEMWLSREVLEDTEESLEDKEDSLPAREKSPSPEKPAEPEDDFHSDREATPIAR